MATGFENVRQHDLCAGCGLCSSVFSKIKLDYNAKGFIRPEPAKLSKNEDEAFRTFCPGYRVNHEMLEVKDYVWGSYKDILFAYSKDDNIRQKSSSGGIISSILVFLLEKGYIDAVIHTGESIENPLFNEVKISNTREEIIKYSGSRYSPSAPMQNLAQLLENNKIYAFVGKPCDVDGIRMYSEIDERVKTKIPYILSFFCAGVPSINGTKKLLEKFDVKEEDVKSLKYRGEGWPGLTKIETKDGKVYTMKYSDSWGKILNRYLQKRCKICIDAIGEFSDIVCGDGWFGDEKGYPKFEEGLGRSLVILRNENGKRIFNEAVKENYIAINSGVDLQYLKNIQPFQYERKTTLISKILSMKAFRMKTPEYSWNILINASKNSTPKKLALTFMGTTKRIVHRRL